ncbi:glycylpeptide N-tetradecanoyltransferase [Saxophila tyrrhenica]|uniref:Glycylpeptide N-tetradecanoyltransferase n=1 Tax=Saxophila tyrrhenica TaxID=1690608 RepID=A0AAV9NWF1_9PEZI|nr:glycylpeptide N-tetradecanoyltransferase [Saxophila tyrrhenica]
MAAEQEKTADVQIASDVADKALEDPSNIAENTADADEDAEEEVEEDGEVEAGTAAEPSKKKKKPKKKKKKAATSGEGADSAAGAQQPPRPAQVQNIQSLLQQLAVSQQGQKQEGKAPEDYKFWNTQPVPKFKEPPNLLQTTDSSSESLPEGPILPDKVCRASAKEEPEKLVEGFEWSTVDIEDKGELQELYELLDGHYVEDTDGSFRFKYSVSFLSWALKPPGWKKEWHIGVRTKSTTEGKRGRLVAFIAGIPVTLKVGEHKFKSTEINFLTVHHKLRGKRLAPVMIKEVTRRCYLNGIYQALYTAGTILPTPVSTCRYYHRSLDWEHLYKCGFSHVPPGTTELRQKYKYKVDTAQTKIKGMRPMKPDDIEGVRDLLVRYLERFKLRQEWTAEEIAHWLCSDASKDVVWSWVVDKEGGGISDFVSYYLLESTVLKSNQQKETIRAAYLYYLASDTAFPPTSGPHPKAAQIQLNLASRLQALMHDAIVQAKRANFHVFNALTLLDNPLFFKELKFERGDGKLNFYLFNWRTEALGGGVDGDGVADAGRMGGVGVVML